MNKVIEQIEKHSPSYKPIPFWSWNDKLEPNCLKKQIHWMKRNGIGGFIMHARGGLMTDYLSEQWMDCIEECANEAKVLGMTAWIYDENGWPSGFAGGKLLEEIENHDMYIKYDVGELSEKATISYLISETHLIRVEKNESVKQGSCYLNLYIFYSPSTADILNPAVVDQFLEITHEKYKERFSTAFSEKIQGFFTDEPQYYGWDTPYTPMIADYFKKEYKEDILDRLGLLFVEKEGYEEFRYRYWHAMQQLMLQNFAQKIYEWCEHNKVKLTGHFVEEDTLSGQMMYCAGIMPFYEYEHIPGIDWLGKKTENELSPRQLGSVVRQLKKKTALTETFGCCGWDVTPEELRRIAGFQYACGVNLMCHHLVPYSERGQRKRDYPAHFHEVNPWIQDGFLDFNEYFSKLGALLAESEEVVNVAVLHPIRSAYFSYQWSKTDSGYGVTKLEEQLHKACRMLSSRGIAYHFLDETLLEKYGFVSGQNIGCGCCTYNYLVIPQIITMGERTEQLLQQFVLNEGKVLLLDKPPQYLEGRMHEYPYLKSNCSIKEIAEAQEFMVEDINTEIFCTYHKLQEQPFLFLQNASGTRGYSQTFCFAEGFQSFVKLDLNTMKQERCPLMIYLEKNESMFLIPSYEKLESEEHNFENNYSHVEFSFEKAEVEFDKNFLVVDTISYSMDGRHYSDPILRNELYAMLLEKRYEGRIWLRYEFEIQVLPARLELITEKSMAEDFKMNGIVFEFDRQDEHEKNLWIKDVSNMVKTGVNRYELALDWHQSEETYYALFGENVTESLRNCIVYDSEIEAVYLMGKFGVYSHSEFEAVDGETVYGKDFYIGEVPTTVSELTTEGFSFFRGSLVLKQRVFLEQKNTILELKGRYVTANVYINGKKAGDLFFEHSIDISKYAEEGENFICVHVCIGNRNLLGPFHHCDNEDFVSPELFEAYTPEDLGYRLKLFYKYEEKEGNS